MAISSYNSSFITGSGSIIGEITAISFSGISAAEIDVTSLTSTTKNYVLGTADGGTVEITCNMNATAPALPTSGSATATSFVVRFGPVGTATLPSVTATFSAFIANTSFEAAVDSQVVTTYTLRISGAITMGTSTSL